MLNIDGSIVQTDRETILNRAFLFGDGVFETFRISNGRVLFLEDHYFRLMSAMRIVRMEIPMSFTMEFIESQVLSLVGQLGLQNARARMTVYRRSAGLYLPDENDVSYVISASALDKATYQFDDTSYEVDLYKDFYIASHLLSTIKTTNRILNVTGSIYADENGFDNCLLLNEKRNVVEALNGNLFVLIDGRLVTPALSEGCLNGIMRKQVIANASKLGIDVQQTVLSPFELQKADEMFITNVISGIRPVTKYRKKEYQLNLSRQLVEGLNEIIG